MTALKSWPGIILFVSLYSWIIWNGETPLPLTLKRVHVACGFGAGRPLHCPSVVVG